MQRAVRLAGCARAGSENSQIVFVDFTVTLQVNTADNNEITETTENSEESKKVSKAGRLGNRLSD